MAEPTARTGVAQLRRAGAGVDLDAAVRFYRDVLGLPEELVVDSEGGARVVILDAGRATLELVNPAQKALIDDIEVGAPVAPRIRVALEVADTRQATEDVVAAGAELLGEPRRTPWDSLNARVNAPDGLQLTLFEELGEG